MQETYSVTFQIRVHVAA